MHADRGKQNKAMSRNIKENPVNCSCSLLCYSSMIFNKTHEISSLSVCTECITAWILKNNLKVLSAYLNWTL